MSTSGAHELIFVKDLIICKRCSSSHLLQLIIPYYQAHLFPIMPSHAEATEKTRAALQKVVDAGIPGVIVCLRNKKGEILFHEAAGLREVGKEAQPMQKGDYNWIASCTKLITAIAVLQLVEQGKVKLDDSVEKILPELANLKM